MRTLTTILSIMALTFSLGCSGGDNGDGGGPTPDANTAGAADANTTAGPDAMQGGGGAANLGRVCTAADPCPTGVCTFLTQGATTGMCSLACTMAGMADVCGAADGFPGPGVAYCGLGAAPNLRCAVGCGEQNGGDTACPTGLTCQDLIDANQMPDLCAPPPA